MKLVRYGKIGSEKPGLMVGDTLRDLSAHLDDVTGAVLDDATLGRLRDINPFCSLKPIPPSLAPMTM